MRKWLLVGCGAFVTLSLIACIGGTAWLFRTPKIEIPTRAYPPNNAYESYRLIAEQMRAQLDTDQRFKQIEQSFRDPQSLSAADRAYYLQRTKPFLTAYAPFTQLPSKAVFEYRPDWLMPELAQFRRIARAEAFLIRESLQRKRYADALERVERLNRFAEQVRTDGTLIHYLVGTAIHAIALDPLRETLPTLQDRAALERLVALAQRYETRRAPLWRAATQERIFILSVYDQLAKGKTDLNALTGDSSSSRISYGPLIRPLVNLALSEYHQMMDSVIAELKKPMHQRDRKTLEQEPRQLLNAILYPVFMRTNEKEIAESAMMRLAGCTAAIRLYKQRTGKYPQSLEALGLGEMVIDPFTGEPFRYRVDPKRGFLLYSVGENRTDDGGYIPYAGQSASRGDFSAVSVRLPNPPKGIKHSQMPLAPPVWLK
ncbi:MAG: hypothetical protein ACK4ME_11810 [Fimbriimonadales bacterium]